MASAQLPAEMCGTPKASRTIVARCAIGAEILPDTWGNGRYATQYTAINTAMSKTAMLKLMYFRTLLECTRMDSISTPDSSLR